MSLHDTLEAAAQIPGEHTPQGISITPELRSAGKLDDATLAEAERLFRENGYLVVRDLFTDVQMTRFEREFKEIAGGRLTETNKRDKRPLFTVPIRGAFASSDVLDNPFMSPLLARLLGHDYIIGAVSAVASFPGAPDQFLHRDARPLFAGDDENAIDAKLPPYSITMLAPLIDVTQETGCTRVWPGSHAIVGTEQGLAVGSLDPELRTGSVLITDGRVLHRGAENASDRVRPLFYLTFQRAWFRDFGGYSRRLPVDISASGLKRLPQHVRARVSWPRAAYTFKTMLRYRLAAILPPAIRTKLMSDT